MADRPAEVVTAPSVDARWWRRNWKWFVPMLVITPMVFSMCCLGGGLIAVVTYVRKLEVYQLALAEVRADPQVQAALGTPMEEGWFAQSQVSSGAGGRSATVTFNLAGPSDSATAQAAGQELPDGTWRLTALVVYPRRADSGITLRSAAVAPGEAAESGDGLIP